MDRVFQSGAVPSLPSYPTSPSNGYPTAGNQAVGTPATVPGPWWHYMLTEEMRNLLVALGGTPNGSAVDQLATAIVAKLALYAQLSGAHFTGGVTIDTNASIGATNGSGETQLAMGNNLGYFFNNPSESGFNTPGSVDGYWTYNRAKKNLTVSGWDVWHNGVVIGSYGPTGYVKYPDGRINQWGITGNLASETYQDIVFPVSFIDGCWNVQSTAIVTSAIDDQMAFTGMPTLSGVRIFRGTAGAGVTENLPIFWKAEGK